MQFRKKLLPAKEMKIGLSWNLVRWLISQLGTYQINFIFDSGFSRLYRRRATVPLAQVTLCNRQAGYWSQMPERGIR